eukprot:jgi/Mesen1/5656/ME000286S04872
MGCFHSKEGTATRGPDKNAHSTSRDEKSERVRSPPSNSFKVADKSAREEEERQIVDLKKGGFVGFDKDVLLQFDSEPPREFVFSELQAATENFSEDRILGEGGYGKVFEGWVLEKNKETGVEEGKQVAIKLLNQEGLQGFNEWLTEVIFLRRLHHPHLVHLVGYCSEANEGCLVYEYMPNGSLDYHLFNENGVPLSWVDRVKVALGAAEGLAYLHEGTDRQVIFRDLKAGNILLDQDFTAKLSDFGLAKDGPAGDKTHVSTKVVGTYGYTAPEYMQTGHLTAKSDVYAFGVVLLELISGRRAVDMDKPWEERSLVFWAKQFLADRRKLHKLVDPRLGKDYPLKAAQKLAVSAHCCLLDAKSRPSMKDMVQTLKAVQELKEPDQGLAAAS